jgi:cytochrome d ubiquinol oxidase subunit II
MAVYQTGDLTAVAAQFVQHQHVAQALAEATTTADWFTSDDDAMMAAAILAALWLALRHLPDSRDRWSWTPFAGAVALFVLAFTGLAYSFYPYVVPERMTVFEAASAPESLFLILIGALFVLPMILAYTALAYVIFRGKATELRYD